MRDYIKIYPIKKLNKLQTNYFFAQYKYFYDTFNNRDVFRYFITILDKKDDQYNLLKGHLFNFSKTGTDLNIIDFLIETSAKNNDYILLPSYCKNIDDWIDYTGWDQYEYLDTYDWLMDDDIDFMECYNYSGKFINYYQQNLLLNTQIKGKYARRKKR